MQMEFSKMWVKILKIWALCWVQQYVTHGGPWALRATGLGGQSVWRRIAAPPSLPLRTCPYPVVSRTPPCRQERPRAAAAAEEVEERRQKILAKVTLELEWGGELAEWQQVGRHQSRDQVSSTQKNHQRASFLENANEPFGENLCVGLRASKSLCPPRFRWGQKDPSLTHILVRESLLWWKHWRWWSSALKNLDQTFPTVCYIRELSCQYLKFWKKLSVSHSQKLIKFVWTTADPAYRVMSGVLGWFWVLMTQGFRLGGGEAKA